MGAFFLAIVHSEVSSNGAGSQEVMGAAPNI
jgi:hypothetical protein